jgi:hypothetical protein
MNLKDPKSSGHGLNCSNTLAFARRNWGGLQKSSANLWNKTELWPSSICSSRATHSATTSVAVASQHFIIYLTTTSEHILFETHCSHITSLNHAIHLYVCLDCAVSNKSIIFMLQAHWWMVWWIFAFTFWPRTSFLTVSDNRVKDPFCKRNICDGNC